jgi:glucan 1,3-beta-glucosidase
MALMTGYWAFIAVPGEPYIQGFQGYLDQAITWAQQCGLKVWIDLHGAPGIQLPISTNSGSQNGFDNSGQRGPVNWGTGDTVTYTQQTLQVIVNKYSAAPYAGTVVGIELLNEPNGFIVDQYNI